MLSLGSLPPARDHRAGEVTRCGAVRRAGPCMLRPQVPLELAQ